MKERAKTAQVLVGSIGQQGVRRAGATKQVALKALAAVQQQKVALARALHPFGHHVQAQAAAQRHHRAGDGGVVGVTEHVAHKALVDFELPQRQALEVDSEE